MGACIGMIQNRCRMQRRCGVGWSSSTASLEEGYPHSSMPLSQWDSSRNAKKTKGVWGLVRSQMERGSH